MAQESTPSIALLVSQHPAINHSVILREIRELRKSLDLRTASIRSPDRPLDQLSEEERNEASITYYIKPQGIGGALAALTGALFSLPVSLFSGWFYALKLSGPNPKKAFRNTLYFVEAVMLGRWMRQKRLKHLHVHYSSTIGLLAKRIFPIRLSISFHGPDEFNDPEGFWLSQKVEASDFVRAISYYARSQLMKCCSSDQWDKIEVAYMAVDPQVFCPRPFRENSGEVEIICVGRLAPVKAQHVLIEAVAKLVREGRKVLLHLVGGGPDRSSLERHVDALGIRPQVVFHGFTAQERLNELYSQADIFALASFAEGLPGVLMEAMAMEIPCVSTWITGVPELIRDGIDGILVPPADACALASGLARLIDDPELRRRIGIAGRARILDKFHLEKNAQHLASIFQRRALS
jgi:colanic acid/amylovoran biosynthesis glycosyltransferase